MRFDRLQKRNKVSRRRHLLNPNIRMDICAQSVPRAQFCVAMVGPGPRAPTWQPAHGMMKFDIFFCLRDSKILFIASPACSTPSLVHSMWWLANTFCARNKTKQLNSGAYPDSKSEYYLEVYRTYFGVLDKKLPKCYLSGTQF